MQDAEGALPTVQWGSTLAENNTFSENLIDSATGRQRARLQELVAPRIPKPKAPSTFTDVATIHQVPENVIRAVTEEAGISDPQEQLRFADEFAGRIGHEIKSGKSIPDAMQTVFGPEAPIEPVLERAKAMAGGGSGRAAPAPEPEEAPDGAGSALGDAGRMVAGGIAKGTGSAIQGMGRFVAATRPEPTMELEVDPATGKVVSSSVEWQSDPAMIARSREAGQAVSEFGKRIQAGVSEESRAAIADSTPDGDLFKPSTWTLGENPSVRGYAMLTADVLGSLAPVVLASVATRSPVGGAFAGGAQSAGAGAEQARETVTQAGHERLQAESAFYRDAVASGASPEEAMELTAQAAERLASLYSAPIGAFGGAVTGQIAMQGLKSLAGKNVAARVGGTAAVSGAEEGAQEVAESVAANLGTKQGSGLNVDLTEGTFADAVLGALAGAPVGAVGGLRGKTGDEGPELDALPAPDAPPALPAPAPALERPEMGNLARAAQAIAPAPSPLLDGTPEGARVRVQIPGGQELEGTFKGEDRGFVSLELDGEPVQIPREDIENGNVSLTPVDVLAEKSAPQGQGDQPIDHAPIETEGMVEVELSPFTIPPRDQDIQTDLERGEMIRSAISTAEKESGATLTGPEWSYIHEHLAEHGGVVEDAVWGVLERELELESEPEPTEQPAEDTAIPFGDQGAALRQPVEEAGREAGNGSEGTSHPIEPGVHAGAESESGTLPETLEVGGEPSDAGRDGVGPEEEPSAAPVIENIHTKAAVLRGIPEDQPPQVEGVSIKWDARENGFIFSRKYVDKVRAAVTEEQPAAQAGKSAMVADAIEAAAEETATDPTPAQAEAENYKTGKAPWNGLTLSIENKKGSTRRKVTPNGETAWEVEMPAHYGRILRTEGADGDHVDFYMGDNPEAQNAWVIDQLDADAGTFDEHKVMLGFIDVKSAKAAYMAGFSDGKGPDRLGGIRKISVDAFKAWLDKGDTKSPVTAKVKRGTIGKKKADEVSGGKENEPDNAEGKASRSDALGNGLKNLSDAENAELAALEAEFLSKLKEVLRMVLGRRRAHRGNGRHLQPDFQLRGRAEL